MANVIIKSDEQRRYEDKVLHDFHRVRTQGSQPTKEQREAAEVIARRSAEYAQNANKR